MDDLEGIVSDIFTRGVNFVLSGDCAREPYVESDWENLDDCIAALKDLCPPKFSVKTAGTFTDTTWGIYESSIF